MISVWIAVTGGWMDTSIHKPLPAVWNQPNLQVQFQPTPEWRTYPFPSVSLPRVVYKDGQKYTLSWTLECWELAEQNRRTDASRSILLRFEKVSVPDPLSPDFVLDRIREWKILQFQLHLRDADSVQLQESTDLHPLTLPKPLKGVVWNYSADRFSLFLSPVSRVNVRTLVIVDDVQKSLVMISLECEDEEALDKLWKGVLASVKIVSK